MAACRKPPWHGAVLLVLFACCQFYVSADMTFDEDFIFNLPGGPIRENEYLCNCTVNRCGLTTNGRYSKICRTMGGCLKTVQRPDPEEDPEIIHVTLDCIQKEHWAPPERPIMCQNHHKLLYRSKTKCCQKHFCNPSLEVNLDPMPITTTKFPESGWNPTSASVNGWLLGVVVGIPFVVITGIILALIAWRCRRKYEKPIHAEENKPFVNKQGHPELNNINQMLFEICEKTSGSGSGLPLLEQRRVARQIDLKDKVGEGRFGVVHVGIWKGDRVAVKIFQSRDEKSWFREVEIYNTSMLRNDNLLTFYASDNKDATTETQLWLITEYHPLGSLLKYLDAHTVNPAELCLKARSIASGLAFLHSEIVGSNCKPAIAHRDLKSTNILVKTNGECCIADLGLAVRYWGDGRLDLPSTDNVGTRRYCAPEVLSGKVIQFRNIDSFQKADIYSLGLVLWELCRRTAVEGVFEADEYELPYFDLVKPDPSVDEMKRVVCEENKRPTIPNNKWMTSPVLRKMSQVMKECWAANPSSRLPALRVKKSVDSLSAAVSTTAEKC